MNALLWTLQIVLALVFAAAGTVKLIRPRDRLAETLGGCSSLSVSPNYSAP